MALIHVERLPDRYKVVFRNAAGDRQRVFITEAEYLRPDRDQYIKKTYGPTGRDWESYMWWYVPFIDTFDTPSQDLEPGMVWEGVRERSDPKTQRRVAATLVVWRDESGNLLEAKPADLDIVRKDGKIETVTKKRQGVLDEPGR